MKQRASRNAFGNGKAANPNQCKFVTLDPSTCAGYLGSNYSTAQKQQDDSLASNSLLSPLR